MSPIVLLLLSVVSIAFALNLDLQGETQSNAAKPYTVRILKSACLGYPNKYARVMTCRTKVSRNAATTISFHGTLIRPIETMFGSFGLNYKYTNGYQPLLIELQANACELLAKEMWKRNKVAKFLYELVILEYVPWIKPCPWPPGNYSVVDFTMKESKMPNFLPAGDFRFDMRLYDADNETILIHQIFFSIRAKGILDLSMGKK